MLLLSSGLHDKLVKVVKEQLFVDENADKNRKILSDLLLNLEDKSELESRDDDKDWFEGTEFTRYCRHTANYFTDNEFLHKLMSEKTNGKRKKLQNSIQPSKEVQLVNPVFHPRRRFSVQDQVVLLEEQL